MKRLRSVFATALLATPLTLWPITIVFAQSSVIQITAPISGTIVSPSTPLSVKVSTEGTVFTGVQIVAGDLGVSEVITKSPYTFQMTVPQIAPGQQSIVAVGLTSSGAIVQSAPVVVDVEPERSSITVKSLRTQLTVIGLHFIGEQIHLPGIDAFMSDGTVQHVGTSTKLKISSTNDQVTVIDNSTQLLTAVGPGKANIDINYLGASTTISLSVPNSIRGDLNADGIVDENDLAILEAALNTKATTPKDARDLNHDGLINSLDEAILKTLCTHPNCTSK